MKKLHPLQKLHRNRIISDLIDTNFLFFALNIETKIFWFSRTWGCKTSNSLVTIAVIWKNCMLWLILNMYTEMESFQMLLTWTFYLFAPNIETWIFWFSRTWGSTTSISLATTAVIWRKLHPLSIEYVHRNGIISDHIDTDWQSCHPKKKYLNWHCSHICTEDYII